MKVKAELLMSGLLLRHFLVLAEVLLSQMKPNLTLLNLEIN